MEENQNQRNFLERLQTADERIKNRWLIGITAVVMILVIFVWLVYFNSIVTNSARPPALVPEREEEFGFWGTITNGTAHLYQSLKEKVQGLAKILDTPRSYIVKPPVQ